LEKGVSMSGRKSWEVANVLDEVERSRNTIVNRIKTNLQNGIGEIRLLNRQLLVEMDQFRKTQLSLEKVYPYFPEEAQLLENRLAQLKREISQISLPDSSEIEKKLKYYLEELQNFNSQIAYLRNKINNSYHYMNSEYNQAVQLNQQIAKIISQIGNLENLLFTQQRKIREGKNQLEIAQAQLEELKKEGKKAEQRAKIRKEALKLKQEITIVFQDINTQIALKFMENEYRELGKKVEKFQQISDNQAIAQFQSISAQLSQFKGELGKKYAEWLEKKRKAENYLNTTLERVGRGEMVLLEDKYNGVDRKVSPLTYLDRYTDKKVSDKFNKLIAEAKKAIEREEFQEGEEILGKANQLFEKAVKEARKLEERLESSAQLALNIRDIMLDKALFTSVNVEIIGNNPVNGFRIECSNGDLITFEKVTVDEKGEVIVELDHQIRTGHKCEIKWKDLKQLFNKNGIPLLDVVKDGRSLIYDQERESIKAHHRQRRRHRE